MSDDANSIPRPRATTTPLQDSPAPAKEGRSWFLAGALGIAGGYILMNTVPQFTNALMVTTSEVLPFLVMQMIFGFACTVIAYLNAPGKFPSRIVGTVLFVLVAALAVALHAARLFGFGGGLFHGFLGGLFSNYEGWIVLAGGAGWLIASGARPIGWLILVGALLVAPLRMLLVMQDLHYMTSTIVLNILMLVVAVGILLASKPRTARPLGSPQSPYENMPAHNIRP